MWRRFDIKIYGWVCGLFLISLSGCALSPHTSHAPHSNTKTGGLFAPSALANTGSVSANNSAYSANSKKGGYYLDDGPEQNPPADLQQIPDAELKLEPLNSHTRQPYTVFGKRYTPLSTHTHYEMTGRGSWYGKKFHKQKTASGEIYDMYKMTAAHPTLPIPSYARVTNLANGKEVIVRINDRGPFHTGRIIDLSYTAALKLGFLNQGSAQLRVQAILPEEIAQNIAQKNKLDKFANRDASNAVINDMDTNDMTVSTTDSATTSTVNTMALGPAKTVDHSIAKNSEDPIEAIIQSALVQSANPQSNNAFSSEPKTANYVLQLGAYSTEANAQTALLKLRQELNDSAPDIKLLAQSGSFRLYCGPYTNRSEAEKIAQRIRSLGKLKPYIAEYNAEHIAER